MNFVGTWKTRNGSTAIVEEVDEKTGCYTLLKNGNKMYFNIDQNGNAFGSNHTPEGEGSPRMTAMPSLDLMERLSGRDKRTA